MAGRFQGKTLVVTGAARGVGRAIAARLIDDGARVMLADRDDATLADTAKAFGGDAKTVQRFGCDLSQRFGVHNLMAATLNSFEHIDGLITTPSDFERADPLSLTSDALERVLAANLRSAFLLSQVFAQKMIAAREAAPDEKPTAAIVHVSSMTGQKASAEIVAYSISCAALDQLTRCLAVALAPHGIRVNGVAPGSVMTDTLRDSLQQNSQLRKDLTTSTPLGRIADASEAAEVALFLASDRASFVTGQIVNVDGGRSVLDPLAIANV